MLQTWLETLPQRMTPEMLTGVVFAFPVIVIAGALSALVLIFLSRAARK